MPKNKNGFYTRISTGLHKRKSLDEKRDADGSWSPELVQRLSLLSSSSKSAPMSPVFLKNGRSKTKTNSVFFPPNFENISKNQITDIRDIRRSRLRHTVSESQILDRKTYSITI